MDSPPTGSETRGGSATSKSRYGGEPPQSCWGGAAEKSAAPRGFEPRRRDPESRGLPLADRAVKRSALWALLFLSPDGKSSVDHGAERHDLPMLVKPPTTRRGLKESFSSDRLSPSVVVLLVDQLPRPMRFRISRATCIMDQKPLFHMACGANIPTIGLRALQDIDRVSHEESRGSARRIRGWGRMRHQSLVGVARFH